MEKCTRVEVLFTGIKFCNSPFLFELFGRMLQKPLYPIFYLEHPVLEPTDKIEKRFWKVQKIKMPTK